MPGYLDRLVARMGAAHLDMTAAPQAQPPVDATTPTPAPPDEVFDPFEAALDEDAVMPPAERRPVSPTPLDAQPPVMPPRIETHDDASHATHVTAPEPAPVPPPVIQPPEREMGVSTNDGDLPVAAPLPPDSSLVHPIIHEFVIETAGASTTTPVSATPPETQMDASTTTWLSDQTDESEPSPFVPPEPASAPPAFDLAALMQALYPPQPETPAFEPASSGTDAVPPPVAPPDAPRVTIGEIRVEIVRERETPVRAAPAPRAAQPSAPRPAARSKRGYGLSQS